MPLRKFLNDNGETILRGVALAGAHPFLHMLVLEYCSTGILNMT